MVLVEATNWSVGQWIECSFHVIHNVAHKLFDKHTALMKWFGSWPFVTHYIRLLAFNI